CHKETASDGYVEPIMVVEKPRKKKSSGEERGRRRGKRGEKTRRLKDIRRGWRRERHGEE
ncbi:hypothetical protein Pmani_033728, partial [Petrolisthes manimaculis]